MRSAFIKIVAIVALTATGCINAGTLGEMLGDDGALDEATVAAGLKEALQIGTERSTCSGRR